MTGANKHTYQHQQNNPKIILTNRFVLCLLTLDPDPRLVGSSVLPVSIPSCKITYVFELYTKVPCYLMMIPNPLTILFELEYKFSMKLI